MRVKILSGVIGLLLINFGCASRGKNNDLLSLNRSTAADVAKPFPMAIVGDAGLAGSDLDLLRDSIALHRVQSLILTGDNLYFGSYSGVWDQWKRNGFRFDVMAIGNHHKGYENEIKYFGAPGEFYSVVKNGARFIVLNSDNQANLEAQFTWLNTELTEAHEALIFLVYHHPTYSSGSDDHWDQKAQFQTKMREIFELHKNKISAVLLGHAHISSVMSFGSIPAIIAGAGREVLKATPVSKIEDGVQVQTMYLAPRIQHWVKLEISENANEAWFHFVRVSDQTYACTAHLFDNKIDLSPNCH